MQWNDSNTAGPATTGVVPARTPQPARPSIPPAGGEAAAGLCANCEHARSCTFPRRADRAVLSCDEYDAGLPVVSTPIGGHRTVAEQDPPSSALLGLCRNCARRDTCAFPKPESGVWNCEEYL